jgi:hypothetical protein
VFSAQAQQDCQAVPADGHDPLHPGLQVPSQ